MYLLFGWQGIRHRFPRYSTRWTIPRLWVLNLLRRGASPPHIGPFECLYCGFAIDPGVCPGRVSFEPASPNPGFQGPLVS